MSGRDTPGSHDTPSSRESRGSREPQGRVFAPKEAPGGPPALDFEKLGGLVTAVVQDAETGEVRMVGFMNPEAWRLTLETGYTHFYSRSRGRLWKKGESSGNVQEVREIRIDCDQDAVLLQVRQAGDVTCHTGERTCFYRRLHGGRLARID